MSQGFSLAQGILAVVRVRGILRGILAVGGILAVVKGAWSSRYRDRCGWDIVQDVSYLVGLGVR
jgi:hypothetical protein